MAHSDRNRLGRTNIVFKPGHRIGLMHNGEILEGVVGSTDGGDWIYPTFPPTQGYTPGWLRSTQVIDLGASSLENNIQIVHDERTQACRAGWATDTMANTFRGGCFNGVSAHIKQAGNHYPFVIFLGDGPEFPFHILHDRKAQNEILKARTQSWNEFKGTPRSLYWVEFCLSEHSPWRSLHKFLYSPEPERINNSGYIFNKGSGPSLPTKLLYNFCMAQRFCWEQPSEFSTWLALKDQMNPALALFVAMNFKPVGPEIDGKYEIVWPWSFLEDGGIECAYRFVHGKPGALSRTDPEQPNVHALWASGNPDKAWVDRMSSEPQKLSVILECLDGAIDKQGETIKCAA